MKGNQNANMSRKEFNKIMKDTAKTYGDSIKDAWICPQGYQFKDENGNVINTQKIVLEKKKKEYPKKCEILSMKILRKKLKL